MRPYYKTQNLVYVHFYAKWTPSKLLVMELVKLNLNTLSNMQPLPPTHPLNTSHKCVLRHVGGGGGAWVIRGEGGEMLSCLFVLMKGSFEVQNDLDLKEMIRSM